MSSSHGPHNINAKETWARQEIYTRQAPERLDVMSQLGFTLTDLGQISEAQQIAETLVAEHPDAVRTYMLLGFVAVQDARIADGLEAFAKIRELDPGAGIGVSNACFSSLYADFHDATQVTQIHRDMSARVVEAAPAMHCGWGFPW